MGKKLYEEEKVQAIADAIREKTALTDLIDMQQMSLDIRSLPQPLGSVPDYVCSEAERVAAAVKPLLSEDSLCFIALSDVHVGSDQQSRASALHAFQGARLLQKLLPVDFSVVLGDWVTGGTADNADIHTANHLEALSLGSILHPELRLVGNHDQGSYNESAYLSAADTNKYIGRYSSLAVKPSSESERGYFYYDLTEKKTRVICLNTGDLKDLAYSDAKSTDGHYMSAAQFRWLVDTLSGAGTAGMTRILLLSHHPIHWYGYMPSVLTVLNAYIAGSSGSVTVNGASVSYDFSGKNSAQLIGCFHGHTHNFISGKAGEKEIIRLGTPNACFSRSNEYGSTSYGDDFRNKYGETTTYSKTANSAEDTAFVVNVIDFGGKTIHSIHYGAGYDRSVSYGGEVYYTVSYALTSVDSSSAAASVKGGEAYTTTLSTAENYTIQSVTVTMGGEDITASAYSGGVISIAEVTGDIVITAVATGFTNLVETIGISANTRLSTSTGDNKTQSGYATIGANKDVQSLIHLAAGDVLRVKGISLPDANDGNSAVVEYTSSAAWTSATYLHSGGMTWANTTFNIEGDLLTVSATREIYLRISAICTDTAAVIVTVNEEIS